MSDAAYDYLFNILFCGLLAGLGIYVWKNFGVRGLFLRFALVVDSMLVFGVIAHLRIPLTHLAIPKPHHGDALWWWYVAAFSLGKPRLGKRALSKRPDAICYRPPSFSMADLCDRGIDLGYPLRSRMDALTWASYGNGRNVSAGF
jgi:hypothetical protein